MKVGNLLCVPCFQHSSDNSITAVDDSDDGDDGGGGGGGDDGRTTGRLI